MVVNLQYFSQLFISNSYCTNFSIALWSRELEEMELLVYGNTSEDNGTHHGITDEDIILIAMGSVGFVSFLMCIVAVSSLCCLKLCKVFTYRLAMYQVLASMMLSFVTMILIVHISRLSDSEVSKVACKAGAFLFEYFLWVKLLFVMNIIFHMLFLELKGKSFEQLELVYILFSTVFPLTFSWIPFLHDNYGTREAWCWILGRENLTQSIWQSEGSIELYALWYIPLVVCMAITFIAIVIMQISFAKRCYKLAHTENVPVNRTFLAEYHFKAYYLKLWLLLGHPIVFFVFSSVSIVFQFYYAIKTSRADFVHEMATSVSFSITGLFSSVLFLVHVALAKHLTSWDSHFFNRDGGSNKPSQQNYYAVIKNDFTPPTSLDDE